MATTDDTDDIDPRDVEQPRGHTSLLTVLMILLNMGGLVGFAFLLIADLNQRQAYAKAVYLRQLSLRGLPLDDADLGTYAIGGAEQVQYLDPPLLKAAYKERQGKDPAGKFLETREILKHNIRYPIPDDMLQQYFKEAKQNDPVGTLKDELKRVKDKL